MTIKKIGRVSRLVSLAALVVLGGCFDEDRVDTLSPESTAEASFKIKVSDLNVVVSDRVIVALDAQSTDVLAGVQGFLRFDPARLTFVGQLPDRGSMVIINESALARGEIRLAAMSPTALGSRVAQFAFEVRSPAYTGGLVFVPEVVANTKTQELRTRGAVRDVEVDAQLVSTREAVRWSYLDWAVFMDPTTAAEVADIKANVAGLPTSGTRYGDATINGTINVSDFADVGNTAVGNREVIIGTTAVDRVTAGNVRPLAAGACLAGFSGTDCSTRVINVTDAIAIGQEAVGTDVAVVGDLIPLPKSSFASGDTVFIQGSTCGGSVVTGTRRFDRDTLYVLQGCALIVGVETGASGEVVFEPGVTIEGEAPTAIYVTRNGRIIADGTPTQPITFTCRGPKSPSCWGGVFVAGNARINEHDAANLGTTFAPAIPGRNPTGGQNQRAGEGGAVNHGGGNDADSSGVIRYARFMYGGRILSGNNELNNLTIGSCGSGTRLDHIQVHGGTDDGLEFFGGRCGVKYLYATANDDDQFDYAFGYDGNVQFVLLQHARVAPITVASPLTGGDKGFEVDNTENAATYNNTPRTNPQVYNVTSVGGNLGTPAGATSHIHYRRGAGGTLRNMLLVRGSVAFTIDNAETCNTTSGFSVGSTFVLKETTGVVTLLNGNAACAPSPIAVGTQIDTATYAAQLKDPFHTTLPDFRPVGNGLASSTITPATPPGGGFFDVTATYFGAVAPIGLNTGAVAWYMGWTLPWQGAATP